MVLDMSSAQPIVPSFGVAGQSIEVGLLNFGLFHSNFLGNSYEFFIELTELDFVNLPINHLLLLSKLLNHFTLRELYWLLKLTRFRDS